MNQLVNKSFERIHRSNLVGMGILPMTFQQGDSPESLGLDGTESYDIPAHQALVPGQKITITAEKDNGNVIAFPVNVRLDTPVEVEYFQNGGILQTVLRGLTNK